MRAILSQVLRGTQNEGEPWAAFGLATTFLIAGAVIKEHCTAIRYRAHGH